MYILNSCTDMPCWQVQEPEVITKVQYHTIKSRDFRVTHGFKKLIVGLCRCNFIISIADTRYYCINSAFNY